MAARAAWQVLVKVNCAAPPTLPSRLTTDKAPVAVPPVLVTVKLFAALEPPTPVVGKSSVGGVMVSTAGRTPVP